MLSSYVTQSITSFMTFRRSDLQNDLTNLGDVNDYPKDIRGFDGSPQLRNYIRLANIADLSL